MISAFLGIRGQSVEARRLVNWHLGAGSAPGRCWRLSECRKPDPGFAFDAEPVAGGTDGTVGMRSGRELRSGRCEAGIEHRAHSVSFPRRGAESTAQLADASSLRGESLEVGDEESFEFIELCAGQPRTWVVTRAVQGLGESAPISGHGRTAGS